MEELFNKLNGKFAAYNWNSNSHLSNAETTKKIKSEIMEILKGCQLEPPVSDDFCEWLEAEEAEGVTYETDCENKFVCGEWEKLYNSFKHCIYCGKQIKIKKPSKNSR